MVKSKKNAGLVLVMVFIMAGCSSSSPKNKSALNSYHRALQLVQSSRDALAGAEDLKASGIYLSGKGTYDLSTRLQGLQPNAREPYPIKEQLAVNLKTGKVAYESDTHVNPDAREWIRYVYDGQNRMLFADLYGGFAFWDAKPGLNDQSKRYTNMVPHLLLDEALTNRSSLKHLGNDDAGNDLISFESPVYGSLTLYFESITKLLSGVEYLKDMPLLGDTSIRLQFKEYKHVTAIGPYPTGYTVTINGKLLKDIDYRTIRAGTENDPVMTIPDSIEVPEMPDPPTAAESENGTDEAFLPDPLTLSERVFVIPNIRSGFHPMVIEFDEFLMVIDTPAGWLEMQPLPAMQWVDGATSSSTGQKLLKTIREKISEKPVRYVALTHFHSDHAGGIRPFIAEGTNVLASKTTAPVIEKAVQKTFSLQPDELSKKEFPLKLEIVDNERTISEGNMEVRLIDVGDNPHANGMLVAYLPNQKILYQSDLFEPTNLNYFPSKSRVPVMKWFVSWLDNSGLDVDRIYAIHAGLRVAEKHLEIIRSMDH